MNLFRAIPQWLAGKLSEYVDNVDFDAVRVSRGVVRSLRSSTHVHAPLRFGIYVGAAVALRGATACSEQIFGITHRLHVRS